MPAADNTTKKLLRPFIENAPVPMFLTRFSQTPQENFHTTEEVEIDIQRDGEDIAVAIVDLSTGQRYSDNDEYSTRAFKPPIFKETVYVNGFQLIKRDPGDNPYADVSFRARAITRIGRATRKTQSKIRRTVEFMWSQVFQTGVVTLVNADGNAIYTVDYQQKDSHRIVAATPWSADGTTGNPVGDLSNAAVQIRTHGHRDPTDLIFGATAVQRFLANSAVKDRLFNDRFHMGELNPQMTDMGATRLGVYWDGSYKFNVWTYAGRYIHPATKVSTPYVGDTNVIMLSNGARLDTTFGAIPTVAPPDPAAASLIPPRIMSPETGMDMQVIPWLSSDRQTLNATVSTRAMAIPTEIDSFASLTVA